MSHDISPRHIRVFLSSPSDVPNERKIAIDVLDQLPYDPLLRGKITVEVVAWDKKGGGTAMIATKTPQEAINEGLPMPSECDIVVVIFWSRMGTPLPESEVKPESYCYPTGTMWAESRYLSGTEWEYVDAMKAADSGGKPLVIVYRRSEPPVITMTDPKFDQKREQWQHVEAFFKSFNNPDGSIRHAYNSYGTPDDFREMFEDHMREQVGRILAEPVRADAPPTPEPPLWEGSPFPGLRAFTPDDAPIFFGRGRETDALIEKVRDSRFVAVVGASGSGKSSLVGAGLIPRLRGNAISGEIVGSKDWHIVTFTPGGASGDPFRALTDALVKAFPALIPSPLEAKRLKDEFVAALQDDPASLVDTCTAALAGQPAWSEVLLFVDQFEELFTVVPEPFRAPFVDLLAATAASTRVRAVVTMRADFYHACLKYKALEELLRTGSFPLGVPNQVALHEMITRPAARAGLVFEDGLPERILEDTGDEPGALALMAYTLDELYKACTGESGRVLSHAAYDALGGVTRAIGTRAHHIFETFSEDEQRVFFNIIRQLLTVRADGVPTRKRISLSQVQIDETSIKVVQAFTDARLFVSGINEQSKEPVIEIAHEALFGAWPHLNAWIIKAKEHIVLIEEMKRAAFVWYRNRQKDAYLWPDERLKLVYGAIRRLGIDLQQEFSPHELAFLIPEATRLLRELENVYTPHTRRSWIGERLSDIGDPRPGVGLRHDGLPDISWCEVPGGEITLKGNAGTFRVEPFYIARYTITCIQFQAFLVVDHTGRRGNEVSL